LNISILKQVTFEQKVIKLAFYQLQLHEADLPTCHFACHLLIWQAYPNLNLNLIVLLSMSSTPSPNLSHNPSPNFSPSPTIKTIFL